MRDDSVEILVQSLPAGSHCELFWHENVCPHKRTLCISIMYGRIGNTTAWHEKNTGRRHYSQATHQIPFCFFNQLKSQLKATHVSLTFYCVHLSGTVLYITLAQFHLTLCRVILFRQQRQGLSVLLLGTQSYRQFSFMLGTGSVRI